MSVKTLRNAAIAAVILAGVLTLGLGYYGFVPGLSAVLGSAKPRDLKVDPTPQDLAAAETKAGVRFGLLPARMPPEGSIRFEGESEVNADFTDRELTALLRSDTWRYGLIDEGQVRIDADGTEEISGLLRLDRVYGYAEARRIDTSALRPYLRAMQSFSHHPAFYLKVRTSWADGKLSLDVLKAEIGRYEFEPEFIKAHAATLTTAVEKHLLDIPGFVPRTASFGGGVMHFDGTVPAIVRWSP